MFNFDGMFNGMFKPVARGCCKMSMNGKVAIKTSTGYKTFDVKKKKLTNCDNFAFDMDGAFWVVPTFKVVVGNLDNLTQIIVNIIKNHEDVTFTNVTATNNNNEVSW